MFKFANNANSLLAADIASGATSLQVAGGDGAKFPVISGGDSFQITVVNSVGSFEIMKVTGLVGDVFTVTRAQEGTLAIPFTAGCLVDHRLTAAALADLRDGGSLNDASVTLAKIANIAAGGILGNNTGGAAAPIALTAAQARALLSLGGAALLNVGTAAGTVAAGDDVRITGAAQKASNLSDLASASSARSNLGLKWIPITVIDFATATAAIDVILPTGLKVIRLTGWIDSDASNGASIMRTSTDGGVTFAAGATDYQYAGIYNASGTTTPVAQTNASGMFVAGSDAQSNLPALFTTVLTLGDATRLPFFKSEWTIYSSGIFDGQFAGFRNSASTVNAIRLLESAGNMAAGHVLIEGF